MRFIISFLASLFFLNAFAQAEVCSVKDSSFKNFFGRFVSDTEFQRSRIVFPLVVRNGDEWLQTPEIKLLSLDEIKKRTNPLILNDRERSEGEEITREFILTTDRYSEVYDQIPDGDSYRVLFSFRNIYGCWYLEEVHDWSQ